MKMSFVVQVYETGLSCNIGNLTCNSRLKMYFCRTKYMKIYQCIYAYEHYTNSFRKVLSIYLDFKIYYKNKSNDKSVCSSYQIM